MQVRSNQLNSDIINSIRARTLRSKSSAKVDYYLRLATEVLVFLFLVAQPLCKQPTWIVHLDSCVLILNFSVIIYNSLCLTCQHLMFERSPGNLLSLSVQS